MHACLSCLQQSLMRMTLFVVVFFCIVKKMHATFASNFRYYFYSQLSALCMFFISVHVQLKSKRNFTSNGSNLLNNCSSRLLFNQTCYAMFVVICLIKIFKEIEQYEKRRKKWSLFFSR